LAIKEAFFGIRNWPAEGITQEGEVGRNQIKATDASKGEWE